MSATSRRAALGGSALAGLASLISLPTPSEAALGRRTVDGPDTPLIACCNRLVAVQRALDEIYARTNTTAEEQRAAPALSVLMKRYQCAEDAVWDCDAPSTLEGLQTLSAMRAATGPRTSEGTPVIESFSDHVAVMINTGLASLKVGA